jgi:hypothetical protein
MRLVLSRLLVGGLLLTTALACGRVPSDLAASSSTPASQKQTSPLPLSSGPTLARNDCVAPPTGARTQALGEDKITLQIPPGWSDTTAASALSETLLLNLNAPPSYGNAHVVVQLHSIIGPRLGSSSHREAQQDWVRLQQISFADGTGKSFQNPNPVMPSQIIDCNFGGEKASFFSFSVHGSLGVAPRAQDPRVEEYRIYVLHHVDQQYPLLYVVRVTGLSAIDQQSSGDIKSMLGSWKWGQ